MSKGFQGAVSWQLGLFIFSADFHFSFFFHTDEGKRKEKAPRCGPIVSGPAGSELLVDRSVADFTVTQNQPDFKELPFLSA